MITHQNYINDHTPVSVSITSNVPAFEKDEFLLSQNPRELIKKMFEYFDDVSKKAGDLMIQKMSPLLDKLSDVEDDENLKKVEEYCHVVPIIGFNSGGYDINVAADEGFMSGIIQRCKDPFVIKEGKRYKVIKTNNFIFLDQMGYCSAGTKLEDLFKAYDVGEQKGWFPYEWFDSYEKLDFPTEDLKIEDFYSSLKNKHISIENFTTLMGICEKEKLQ